MKQLPGFIDSHYSNFVYRLKKSIYGLQQAPSAWFSALHKFLTDFGFQKRCSDASLLIFHHNGVCLIFLTYVDDIILMGNNNLTLTKFIRALADRFALKDLGNLQYFMGVELIQTSDGSFSHKSIIFVICYNDLTCLMLTCFNPCPLQLP